MDGQLRNKETLKQLQTRRTKLLAEQERLDRERKDTSKRYSETENTIKHLDEQIAMLKNTTPGIVITEHAMLRYLERVKGIDLDEIKIEILTEGLVDKINTLINATIPLEHVKGFRAVVRDRVIVSIK